MLDTGPNVLYGYRVEGESMKYASRSKTIQDAALATKRGKRVVEWHVPGSTRTTISQRLAKLQADYDELLSSERT